jgi:hypothetical protein
MQPRSRPNGISGTGIIHLFVITAPEWSPLVRSLDILFQAFEGGLFIACKLSPQAS